MTRSTHCACTSVLVGKKASLDGSTMIARTEDNAHACMPKRFVVTPARTYHKEGFTSANNGFICELNGRVCATRPPPKSIQVKASMKKLASTQPA